MVPPIFAFAENYRIPEYSQFMPQPSRTHSVRDLTGPYPWMYPPPSLITKESITCVRKNGWFVAEDFLVV